MFVRRPWKINCYNKMRNIVINISYYQPSSALTARFVSRTPKYRVLRLPSINLQIGYNNYRTTRLLGRQVAAVVVVTIYEIENERALYFRTSAIRLDKRSVV